MDCAVIFFNDELRGWLGMMGWKTDAAVFGVVDVERAFRSFRVLDRMEDRQQDEDDRDSPASHIQTSKSSYCLYIRYSLPNCLHPDPSPNVHMFSRTTTSIVQPSLLSTRMSHPYPMIASRMQMNSPVRALTMNDRRVSCTARNPLMCLMSASMFLPCSRSIFVEM